LTATAQWDINEKLNEYHYQEHVEKCQSLELVTNDDNLDVFHYAIGSAKRSFNLKSISVFTSKPEHSDCWKTRLTIPNELSGAVTYDVETGNVVVYTDDSSLAQSVQNKSTSTTTTFEID